MKKFLVFGSLATLTTVLVASWLVIQWDKDIQVLRQGRYLTNFSQGLEVRLFTKHRDGLDWLAQQRPVQELLTRGGPVSPELSTLLNQTAGVMNLGSVFLVSKQGILCAASSGLTSGIDVSAREPVRKALSGLPAWSLGEGLGTSERTIASVVPLYQNGAVQGGIGFQISALTVDLYLAPQPGIFLSGPDGEILSRAGLSLPQPWKWDGPQRLVAGGQSFRACHHVFRDLPGYSLVSLEPESLPWADLISVDLVVLLLSSTALLLWRQRRVARERQVELRDRRRLQSLLANLLEGIALVDSRGCIVWANPAFHRFVEWEPGDLSPPLGDLWDRTGIEPWSEVFSGARPWIVFESILRGRKGSWTPVLAGFTRADDQFLLSVLDRSERYRSDQLLRQSQKLSVLGQLSGGIAHDLNNMLGVLMGMADIMKASLQPQDPLQESVDLMLTTLGRASVLADRLLSFARQTPVVRVPLDVTALLRELKFLSRTALPETVDSTVETPAGPLMILGDENLLLSALLNLVLNAGESMPEGGVVRVTGRVGDKDHFLISVEDNGKGMDEATLARIFEPFFSTKLDQKGTGLGLSLVRRTILDHQGTLDVKSQPGAGTSVTVTLPLVQSPN